MNEIIGAVTSWFGGLGVSWPVRAVDVRRRQVAYCRAWDPGEVALRVLAAHMVKATSWWDREEWTKHSELGDQ